MKNKRLGLLMLIVCATMLCSILKVDAEENRITTQYNVEVSLSVPELSSVINHENGVKFSWKKTEGATSYKVYRKLSGSTKWTALIETGDLYYIDTTVESQKTYFYTVKATDGTVWTNYNTTGKKITYIQAPVLKSISNLKDGIKIAWSSVNNASKYNLYRKVENGSFKLVQKSITSLNYTDTNVEQGVKYTYSVKACVNDVWSAYNTTGKTIIRLSNPTISSLTNIDSGIAIKWKAIEGATNYKIYRKEENSTKWTLVSTTTLLSFEDTDVEIGKKYAYTLRVYVGNYYSNYDSTGKSIIVVKTPVMKSVTNLNAGVSIKWASVSGATKYALYRKVDDGSWKSLTSSSTSTSYTDSTAQSGVVYTYTVKAYKETWSGYDKTGKIIMRLESPTVSSVKNDTNGIQVNWDSIEGALAYRVYRKTETDSSMQFITTVSDLSYVDENVTFEQNYSYAIKAVNDPYVSSYYSQGVSIKRVDYAHMKTISNVSKGIKITWQKNANATKYAVYRRIGEGSWKSLTTSCTSTSYTDTSVESGVQYTYRVRAYDETWSGYDPIGMSALCLRSPIVTFENVQSGIKIQWIVMNGATSYNLYKKVDGTWTFIENTTELEFVDTQVSSGQHVEYTVYSLNGDLESKYDSVTYSCVYLQEPETNLILGSNYVKITWDGVIGATSYRVYRSLDGNTYQLIQTTSKNSYNDKSVEGSKDYFYYVVAENGNCSSQYEIQSIHTSFEIKDKDPKKDETELL